MKSQLKHTTYATSQDTEVRAVSDEQQLEFPFESHHQYMARRAKEEEAKVEMVNHPPHYKEGEIECIDYLEDSLGTDGFSFYIEGNVKKYIHRWRHKGGIEDLKKAQWYLTRLIDKIESR